MGMTGTQRLPARLGRYRVNGILGQGAMGVVYDGTDPVLNRRVAIKTILHSVLADAGTLTDASARFVREAQAVARLNHPHIVTVFDFGEEGDLSYLVMEFVQGRELKACFDEGSRFAPAEAVRIVRELLDALEFAHRQGVIHRDVKPANVMLDEAGRVKLTDFGVARLADGGSDRTIAGTMVGTPSHMSPEQIQGLPVGSRTDIFAAGIILYECLTTARPFAGTGVWAVQKQIIHDDPAPPSALRPELGGGFDAIIARALAKDPAQRYASAAEFSAALAAVPGAGGETQAEAAVPAPAVEQAGDDATVILPPPPPPQAVPDNRPPPFLRTAKPQGRTEASALPVPEDARGGRRRGLLLAVAAAGIVAAFALWWMGRPAGPAPVPVHPVPQVAPPPAAVAEPAPPPSTAIPVPRPEVPAVLPPPAPEPPAATPTPEPTPPSPKPSLPAAKPAVATPTTSRPPVRREAAPATQAGARSSARCEALMQRVQLGESLSPELLAVVRKECQK